MDKNKKKTKKKLRSIAIDSELNFLVENGPYTIYDLKKKVPGELSYAAHHGYVKELEKRELIEICETQIAENGKEKYLYGPTKYGVLVYLNENISAGDPQRPDLMFKNLDDSKILAVMEKWSNMFPDVFQNWPILVNNQNAFFNIDDETVQYLSVFSEQYKIENKKNFDKLWPYFCYLTLRICAAHLIQNYDFHRVNLARILSPDAGTVEYELTNEQLTFEFFTEILKSLGLSDNISWTDDTPNLYIYGVIKGFLNTEVWNELFKNWLSEVKQNCEAQLKWMDYISEEYNLSL